MEGSWFSTVKLFFRMLFARWPSDVPHLYPGLSDLDLAQFLTDAEYERIKRFENVYVLPFASAESDPDRTRFGLGLARVMIRNLMLLRDISIHGPEDTPECTYESSVGMIDGHPTSSYVTGVADFGPQGFVLEFEVHRHGKLASRDTVQEGDFKAFLRECSARIATHLVGEFDERVTTAWATGQPRDAEALMRYGELLLSFGDDDDAAKARAAQKLLADDPDCVLPAWEIESDLDEARSCYLAALERDPLNAQLCFLTYINLWQSLGTESWALQYCRRAIELSPGHGKAHMCVPHSAHSDADMLRHSELGYLLLPGNNFAVDNYIIALEESDGSPEKLLELAREGVASDPQDPGNYERMIEILTNAGEYRAALAIAERLEKLFNPEPSARTLLCLRQNPERARRLASGEYDPAAEAKRLADDLRRKVARESG